MQYPQIFLFHCMISCVDQTWYSEQNHDFFKGLYIVFQRRQWHPTPVVLLPGKSHGQGSLVGCSPWGHEESDTTK